MASWDSSVNIQPSYPASQQSSPVIREVVLGDGYKSIAKFGLNTDLKKWNFTFDNLSETQLNTIITFLEARGGQESFDFTPPRESASSKYLCKTWTTSLPYSNLFTVKASFEEVAKP